MSKIEIRQWNPKTETAYVGKTWLKNYTRSRVGTMRVVPRTRLSSEWRGVIDRLMGESEVLVAIIEGTQYIAGFLVYAPGVLHYVFVRPDMRKSGVLDALFAEAEVRSQTGFRFASHLTRDWARLPKRYSHIIYSLGHAVLAPPRGVTAIVEDDESRGRRR